MYYKDTQVFSFFLQDKVVLLALGARSIFSPLPKAFFKMGSGQHVYRAFKAVQSAFSIHLRNEGSDVPFKVDRIGRLAFPPALAGGD